jgi:hypothetical protein
MEEGAKSHGTGNRAKFAFRTIIVLYTLVFAGLVFHAIFAGKSWFTTGLLIGVIYPLVAFYYFYSGYFIPFHREKRRVRVEGKGMVMLLTQWMFPIIVIQIFTCLAFWLTIEHAPFKKTMYTNHYQYGLIYKQLEEIGAIIIERGGGKGWMS